jgi:hypothetical protein
VAICGDYRGGKNGGKSDVCPWILDVMMMHGAVVDGW